MAAQQAQETTRSSAFIGSARRMTRAEFHEQGHDDGVCLEDGTAPPADETLTLYGQHAFVVYEGRADDGEAFFHTGIGNSQYRGASADEVASRMYLDYVAFTGDVD